VRLKVKKAGSVEILAKLQEAAKNTDELMQRMGSYVRAVAVEKIDSGEGLAPWAESTKKKYESTGTSKITASGRVRASVAKKLDQTFRRRGNDEARRELRAVLGGSSIKPKNRTVASLQRKLDRAKQQLARGGSVNIGKRKAEKHKLLGSLGRAFSVKASSSQATVINNVPFSGVLLTGGTVGNGARLPERRYLEVSSEVRRRLADITIDHFLRR
jgi:phage gpG-like protein